MLLTRLEPFAELQELESRFSNLILNTNSGEPESKRINPEAIQNIATYAQDSFFKFTVDKALVVIAKSISGQ